ncbi:MAG: long-chain-fatty-acid--CoA ligase [Armatimonadota bacterium]
MDSIPVVLQQTAARVPDRPAILFADQTISYAQLAVTVERVAAGLADLGVEQGDRVGLLLPNCPQFAYAYLAAARLGAMAVPMNPILAPEEVAYVLTDSGAKVIVGVERTAELVTAMANRCDCVEQAVIAAGEIPEGAVDFRALVVEDTSGLPAPPDAEQVACLQYTSGTTGRPRGAMLTHANLLSNARASAEAVSMTEEDVFLAVLPLFHVFGATVTMIIPITMGAASAHLPRFEPLPVLETIERAGVTIFCGVPSMFAVLAALKSAHGPDLSTLRLCISGGAALPRDLTPIIEERYDTTLLEGYGPTEASPVISVNRTRESRKIGSVGPPLPGVEVEIRDEDARQMKVGEIGEICARGPNVMRGYWQDEEKTAAAIRDGWLYTGDLGHVDEDGYIYIVDRKTDMIIVGGLNVYPREVEDVIRLLDAVRDVAVVGASSRLRGETVCAFIELHEGGSLDESEIIEHCSEHLARYKVPRTIRFTGELPRSATGKVLKRELRGRFSLRG